MPGWTERLFQIGGFLDALGVLFQVPHHLLELVLSYLSLGVSLPEDVVGLVLVVPVAAVAMPSPREE